MAETASGPRYAPEDPTLPKPWRGLVDGTSGYLYFWNPETNVTQYERPKPTRGSASVPSPGRAKPSSNPLSSSVQVHHHRSSRVEEDVRYNGDVNGRPKLAAIPGGRDYQVGQILLLIPWVLVQMYSWGGGIELLPALLYKRSDHEKSIIFHFPSDMVDVGVSALEYGKVEFFLRIWAPHNAFFESWGSNYEKLWMSYCCRYRGYWPAPL